MHIGAILAKLSSESLLSLYPIFVKKIGISSTLQLWTRLITYVAISSLFVDWSFIKGSITSLDAITLGLVNLSHIYFSYEGFRHLDSGVSFAIFNSYPLMILLIAGLTGLTKGLWHNSYILVFVGLALFIYGNSRELRFCRPQVGLRPMAGPSGLPAGGPCVKHPPYLSDEPKNFNYGLAMILLAALTEAFIYFLIRRIPTSNHWNHVFIAYFLGAMLTSGTMFFTEESNGINDIRVLISMVINGIIGSVGYFLRFFASYRLEPEVYAPLSYFGVVMSYVYGILFNNEKLNIFKALGTVSILTSNYFAPKL